MQNHFDIIQKLQDKVWRIIDFVLNTAPIHEI